MMKVTPKDRVHLSSPLGGMSQTSVDCGAWARRAPSSTDERGVRRRATSAPRCSTSSSRSRNRARMRSAARRAASRSHRSAFRRGARRACAASPRVSLRRTWSRVTRACKTMQGLPPKDCTLTIRGRRVTLFQRTEVRAASSHSAYALRGRVTVRTSAQGLGRSSGANQITIPILSTARGPVSCVTNMRPSLENVMSEGRP